LDDRTGVRFFSRRRTEHVAVNRPSDSPSKIPPAGCTESDKRKKKQTAAKRPFNFSSSRVGDIFTELQQYNFHHISFANSADILRGVWPTDGPLFNRKRVQGMDARDALGEPTAYISRAALLHNAVVIRRALAPGVKVCAMVKANAYGHDANLVVDTLCNFSSADLAGPAVDAFAVADLEEAAALPQTSHPILVLRPVENCFVGRQRSKIDFAVRNNWWLTLATTTAADDVARIAEAAGKRANIQIMVDTGMSREGVDLHGLDALLHKIETRPSLRLTGLYTHFVHSEDADQPMTIEQLARFLDKTDAVLERSAGKLLRHTSNSGAVFFSPSAHLDMVRPGISLYGIDPTERPSIERALRPVMRWTAPLIGIREVRKGTTVGYGQSWTAERDTRVGLVPIGYADGYNRGYSNTGVMLVHGCAAPVVGRVSMDLTTIDLGQVPSVAIGDEVTILDNDPLSPASAYKLAQWADTIPYEIFCRLGTRVRRVAIDPVDSREMLASADEEVS
jgi:alanine racemase